MHQIVIKIVIAATLAIIFGNGSVVAFNHMPQKWFEDWEDDALDTKRRILPPKLLEADNAGRQRIPSTPWKYLFVGVFGCAGVYLSISAPVQLEIAVLVLMFVLLEMAIADQLYRIVPDQLNVLLAITAIGFIGYNEKWWEPIAGAGIGLALGIAVLGLGLLIFKSGSIGGADIKFYTCMGLVAGRRGIIVIFVLTTLIFALQSLVKIAMRRGTIRDSNALMPAAFVATTIYMLFLWNLTDMIHF